MRAGPPARDSDWATDAVTHTFACGTDLRGVRLLGADLSGADLAAADLRDANLRESNQRRADLRETRFDEDTQVDPRWRLVREIVMAGAPGRDLRSVDLSEADLCAAASTSANLDGANPFRTNLEWANLSGAPRDLR